MVAAYFRSLRIALFLGLCLPALVYAGSSCPRRISNSRPASSRTTAPTHGTRAGGVTSGTVRKGRGLDGSRRSQDRDAR